MSAADDFRRFLHSKGVTAAVIEGATDVPPGMENMNDYTVTLRLQKRKLTTPFFTGPGWEHPPTAADVLSALISDVQSAESARDFADWASDMGMNTDSRKAEQTYRAVLRSAEKTRKFLGNDFEEFAEAAQDY